MKYNKHTRFSDEEIRREILGITKRCYDKHQDGIFNVKIEVSSIYYEYIPAEYMEDNIPYIVSTGIIFDDGKQQQEAIMSGELCLPREEIEETFKNNFKIS